MLLNFSFTKNKAKKRLCHGIFILFFLRAFFCFCFFQFRVSSRLLSNKIKKRRENKKQKTKKGSISSFFLFFFFSFFFFFFFFFFFSFLFIFYSFCFDSSTAIHPLFPLPLSIHPSHLIMNYPSIHPSIYSLYSIHNLLINFVFQLD